MDTEAFRAVVDYHERSKHRTDRYAASPGYMDWQNQPNPFRFYEGKPPLELPLLRRDPAAGHEDLYRRDNNPARPFNLESIGAFLELSLALSAWKSAQGSRWSLRVNPSSGNLHPTEAHLVMPGGGGLPAGLYHYNPLLHALEPRARVPEETARRLRAHLGVEGFLVGLTSIFWRESWKYGERAFRYCNHDAGHALACLSFAANLLGWRLVYLQDLSDGQVETLLGLDRVAFPDLESEHPDLVCLVCPSGAEPSALGLPGDILDAFGTLEIGLTPNALSRERVAWDIIYRTAEAARKPQTTEAVCDRAGPGLDLRASSPLGACEIIRRRRSAARYDPRGSLARARLLAMLDRTLVRGGCAPFDLGLGEPAVNLLLFVHRVDGLESGLYFFLRAPRDLQELRRTCRPEFAWQAVEEGLPLYRLQSGDFRRIAARVSCHQDIAGESALSLGMIARFEETVRRAPYRYRHLFWEAGMIGQVLYLEAEAHGKRGTGIGCYFDDDVHEILGLADNRHQSLYHFTLGDALEDPRLASHPPYAHLRGGEG